jgi:hypothetical protein
LDALIRSNAPPKAGRNNLLNLARPDHDQPIRPMPHEYRRTGGSWLGSPEQTPGASVTQRTQKILHCC